MIERSKSWRLPRGYQITVVYERSPLVERWGYKPVFYFLAIMLALIVIRVAP